MKIEILGSAGATTTPNPFCECQMCGEARIKGPPYERTGPSVFLHDAKMLFDTPEEISVQLNRSQIAGIDSCFYSHWHPDHTMGRRVWERKRNCLTFSCNEPTNILIPEVALRDFESRLGLLDHLRYMESSGLIRISIVKDREPVVRGHTTITPISMVEAGVSAFEIRDSRVHALLVMDEHLGWMPDKDLQGLDMAILPMGLLFDDPWTGKQIVSSDHPNRGREASFTDTLELIQILKPNRVVLIHIEEPAKLSYEAAAKLGDKVSRELGTRIEFAYDQMIIEL